MASDHEQPGATLATQAADAVVAVRATDNARTAACVRRIVAHTRRSVPVVVFAPDCAMCAPPSNLAEIGDSRPNLRWIAEGGLGTIVAEAGRADVVLVDARCDVAAGWLDGLRAAAYTRDLTATASPLRNDACLAAVPDRGVVRDALPAAVDLDEAAARIAAANADIHPRVVVTDDACIYLRRSAIDLVGAPDSRLGTVAVLDFAERCTLHGLQHVIADGVLVAHAGVVEPSAGGLQERYPYRTAAITALAAADPSPLGRALRIARQAMLSPSISIDARCLTSPMTGTQIHTLELVAALSRTGAVRLRAITPHDLDPLAAEILSGLEHTTAVCIDDFLATKADQPRNDIVHRPFQVNTMHDVNVMNALGEHLVVTHQDLIGYHNPSYFEDADTWLRYRRVTQEALTLADMVLFFSDHARRDALDEDLVPEDRSRVVPIGVDHVLGADGAAARQPAEAPTLAGADFLLVLGTDLRHKNRVFAMRLLEQLDARHAWSGRLVLAGPRLPVGSSAAEEDSWLAAHPTLAPRVDRLDVVSEPEKRWLLREAAAVAYPSTFEGFGLLPFEAARAGTPSLFAATTSMRETLGTRDATLVPWDAAASADLVIAVLRDPAHAAGMVARVRERAEAFTWDTTAALLLDTYEAVLRLPARAVRGLDRQWLTADANYWGLRDAIGPTGLALVGPDDPLLPAATQRTIAALTSRPATRRALLAVLDLARHMAPGRGPDAEPKP